MNGHFRGDFRERRAGDGRTVVTDRGHRAPRVGRRQRAHSASPLTPLELARQRLGWSYRELGAEVGASHVAVFRWCRGLRPAPRSVYVALGVPVPARAEQIETEEHRLPRVTVSLPKGCDAQTALEACVRAVAQALNERGGGQVA